MHNPNFFRNVAFLLLLLSGICLYHGILGFRSPDIFPAILLIIGLLVFPISLMYTLGGTIKARRYNRLRRGKGVLARWTVDRDRWYTFLHLNIALNNAPDARPTCHIPDAHKPRPHGVEVIFGKSAVLLDGHYHSLGSGLCDIGSPRWCEGPPPFIEFPMAISTSDSSPTYFSLRIPTAAGHEAAAIEVYNHYLQRYPPKPS